MVAAADLSGLGVPGRRSAALTAFAGAVASGSLRLDGSEPAATVRTQLLDIPGIGPWTADYLCMRVLHDGDAFPSGDLGLRKAARPASAPARTSRSSAEPWRPWRAYGALHLWESLGSA